MHLSEIQLLDKKLDIPRYNHGNVLAFLTHIILNYLDSNPVAVLALDLEVRLSVWGKRIRPDIAVILNEHESHLTEDGIYEGAPDIVIEAISESSFIQDVDFKKALYAAEGIPEYWIVFPEMKLLTIYQLVNGNYQPLSHAIERGTVYSQVLPDFQLEVSQIFKGVRMNKNFNNIDLIIE
jgi:Uma2 family endonuclease